MLRGLAAASAREAASTLANSPERTVTLGVRRRKSIRPHLRSSAGLAGATLSTCSPRTRRAQPAAVLPLAPHPGGQASEGRRSPPPSFLARTWALIPRPSLSASCPRARQHPGEDPGTHPPQGNLGDQHHGHQPDQPRPQVERQPRPVPVLEERVLGLRQDPAAGQLRELPEQRLVHTQVPELLSI